jgi:hypothetical protein
MKGLPRQPWLVLGGLLIVTVSAAAWVSDDKRVAQDNVTEVVTPTPRRAVAVRTAQPTQTLNLDKLRNRNLTPGAGDPFAIRKKSKPPAPAAPLVVVAPPPPPPAAPPPSAPPLPFSYMGKLIDETGMAIFLVAGDRTLVVREGQTVESVYHLDSVSESRLLFTHLPTGIQQNISIGEPQ